METWTVEGADAKTGKETTIDVIAVDQAEALKIAKGRGLFVASIEMKIAKVTADIGAVPPKKASLAKLIVSVGFVLFLLSIGFVVFKELRLNRLNLAEEAAQKAEFERLARIEIINSNAGSASAKTYDQRVAIQIEYDRRMAVLDEELKQEKYQEGHEFDTKHRQEAILSIRDFRSGSIVAVVLSLIVLGYGCWLTHFK